MIRQLRYFLLLLPLAVLAGCSENAASPAAVQAVHVATMPAVVDDGYAASSSYTGRIEARLESQAGFEIGGLIATVRVDEGDVVTKGSPLAELDTARLAARRTEAAAALEQVRADLALAKSTFARIDAAFAHKGVSQQQLDEARQKAAALEAAVAAANARLDSIDVDIAKATLKAPYSGTIVRRFHDPGTVVAGGQPMFVLQSNEAPEARIGVAPEVLTSLVPGDTYTLTVDDAPVEARLKNLIPRLDEATRTVDAIFVIESPSAMARPGDLARLDIQRFVETPGYWVPVSALSEGSRGLWETLIAEAHGEQHVLERRTVEVLHSEADRAFVRGALQQGDLLVSDGLHRVVGGQTVLVEGKSRLARADRREARK